MGDWIIIHVDGGGGGSGIGEMLLIFLAAVVGFAVGLKALVGAVDSVADKLGIPATVYSKTYNWYDDAYHDKKDFILSAKPTDSNEKEYETSFSKKGTAKVRMDPGMYIISVRNSDYQYVFGKCEAKRMRSYDYNFNGWFDTIDAETLNNLDEKQLAVWVFSGVDDKNVYKMIEDSSVSVSMKNSDGDTVSLNNEAYALYMADISDGYWTVSVSANGYETQTRDMIVDDDSRVYFMLFDLSRAGEDDN